MAARSAVTRRAAGKPARQGRARAEAERSAPAPRAPAAGQPAAPSDRGSLTSHRRHSSTSSGSRTSTWGAAQGRSARARRSPAAYTAVHTTWSSASAIVFGFPTKRRGGPLLEALDARGCSVSTLPHTDCMLGSFLNSRLALVYVQSCLHDLQSTMIFVLLFKCYCHVF